MVLKRCSGTVGPEKLENQVLGDLDKEYYYGPIPVDEQVQSHRLSFYKVPASAWVK